MKHRIGFNKLSKNVSHRQALYRSMATALFKYERIRTTKPKAQEIRRVAEKMITRARTDSVHNRRIIGKRIRDKAVLAKLFTDIAPRFKSRPGGYTRILKLGQRYGDASEMVLLELVERTEAAPRRRKKEAAKAEAEPAKEGAEAPAEAEDKPAKAKAAKSDSSSAKTGRASKAGGAAKAPAKGSAAGAGESSAKEAKSTTGAKRASGTAKGAKGPKGASGTPDGKAAPSSEAAKSKPAEPAAQKLDSSESPQAEQGELDSVGGEET